MCEEPVETPVPKGNMRESRPNEEGKGAWHEEKFQRGKGERTGENDSNISELDLEGTRLVKQGENKGGSVAGEQNLKGGVGKERPQRCLWWFLRARRQERRGEGWGKGRCIIFITALDVIQSEEGELSVHIARWKKTVIVLKIFRESRETA